MEVKVGTAGRDKTPAAPCRFINILAVKCGFAGQAERPNDRSERPANSNAIALLT
jgi:hypothetical protein